MSVVLIASITELCIADHQSRPDALGAWLANKTPAALRAMLGTPARQMYVAERDGLVAAVGAIEPAQRLVSLNYVAPQHRFAGVSTTLLAAMEATLGSGEARLSSTATAHDFYLRRGWADTGETDSYAGMIAFPMRKTL